jgi:hypothetical protein
MKDLLEFSGGARLRDDVTLMAVRYEGFAIKRSVAANFEVGLCN